MPKKIMTAFEITSGVMVLSDPWYPLSQDDHAGEDTGCKIVEPVKVGTWNVLVTYDGEVVNRIARLTIFHEDYHVHV